MSKGWIKYAVTTAIGLLIAFMVLQARDLWTEDNVKEKIEIFCDALFVSGILLTGFGGLMFCSSKGAFDGISYLFHIFFVGHNWSKTKFKERQTYGEYVEEKNAKRENRVNTSFVLIVGAVFLLASILLLIVYSNM